MTARLGISGCDASVAEACRRLCGGSQVVCAFNPRAQIVAHHANVKDSNFDLDYFKTFDLVNVNHVKCAIVIIIIIMINIITLLLLLLLITSSSSANRC
jgi:hypothetical protein